jgi:hypothetical protein
MTSILCVNRMKRLYVNLGDLIKCIDKIILNQLIIDQMMLM